MREHSKLMLDEKICPECGRVVESFIDFECENCDGYCVVNDPDIAHFSSRFIFNSVTLFYLFLYTLIIVF